MNTISVPPMLRLGDDLAVWLRKARPYLQQAPANQHIALLYSLLEADLRRRVHAYVGTATTTLESAIEAIEFTFRITQQPTDPKGDFFTRKQHAGEPFHNFYLALVKLSKRAFPPEGHPGHVFERLISGTTDAHLRLSWVTKSPQSVKEALERASAFAFIESAEAGLSNTAGYSRQGQHPRAS